MNPAQLRNELRSFYASVDEKVRIYNEACVNRLDEAVSDDMSVYRQKVLQYETIAESFTPVIFRESRFYFETGTMSNATQGEGEESRSKIAKNHPGGWVFRRNHHKFKEADPELYRNSRVPFYAWCGEYGDFRWHFSYNMKPVLERGLSGLYEDVRRELTSDCSARERDYLECTMAGLLALKRVSERFSEEATVRMNEAGSPEEYARMRLIRDTAARIPWEAPRDFYEALNTVAFMSRVLGALEGVNLTDMGRLDLNLLPFYENDLKNGRFTEEEIYSLIHEFCLLWDAQPDHEIPHGGTDSNESYTLTIGGYGRDGKPVFNDLTKLFLRVHQQEKLICPKLECRYSASSPKEYLDLINGEILRGRTTMLYLNDDALIPAFEKSGIETADARDYTILGCWEPVIPRCTNEHCGYVNLIKVFEYSIYNDFIHPEITIEPLENASDFEELYRITLNNCLGVLHHKCHAAYEGRRTWPEVDALLLVSSALDDCLRNRRDYTEGGAHYKIDELICTGTVNIVNSLLAIKALCFDRKELTLKEYLDIVRSDWKDAETLRKRALSCPFWGDERPESSALMGRLIHDLYAGTRDITVLYGGTVTLGYMLYLELYAYARTLRATPDGRRDFDFFERGLTPSILHPIDNVTSVINCMRAIDPSEMAGDSVLNLTLSLKKQDLDAFEALMRVSASTAVQALQVNCVSKADLMEAKKDPSKHRDLIVRVCGYSAKFVSLPEMIQDEFLQRNFIEN